MMPPGFLVPVPSGRILVHPIENLARIRVKRWTDATRTYSSQVPQPICTCLVLSRANGLGKLTWPIAGESHLLHQSHILFVVVVTVTSHISAGPVHNVARHLVFCIVSPSRWSLHRSLALCVGRQFSVFSGLWKRRWAAGQSPWWTRPRCSDPCRPRSKRPRSGQVADWKVFSKWKNTW